MPVRAKSALPFRGTRPTLSGRQRWPCWHTWPRSPHISRQTVRPCDGKWTLAGWLMQEHRTKAGTRLENLCQPPSPAATCRVGHLIFQVLAAPALAAFHLGAGASQQRARGATVGQRPCERAGGGSILVVSCTLVPPAQKTRVLPGARQESHEMAIWQGGHDRPGRGDSCPSGTSP